MKKHILLTIVLGFTAGWLAPVQGNTFTDKDGSVFRFSTLSDGKQQIEITPPTEVTSFNLQFYSKEEGWVDFYGATLKPINRSSYNEETNTTTIVMKDGVRDQLFRLVADTLTGENIQTMYYQLGTGIFSFGIKDLETMFFSLDRTKFGLITRRGISDRHFEDLVGQMMQENDVPYVPVELFGAGKATNPWFAGKADEVGQTIHQYLVESGFGE